MKTFFYVLTILGGTAGAFILFGSLLADSAPQQGAGAAMAVAFTVIPYCIARAFEKARQEPLADTLGKLLIAQAQITRQSQPGAPKPN